MNKTGAILGGLAAFAALWSAGWFAGKSLYVEPEADRAVERMRAGSLFFAYDRRAVTGFPFGYDIAFEDVSVSDAGGLWRWRAPSVSVSAGLSDPAALVIRPAPESRLTVESAAFGAGGAPASVFDVEAEGFVVTLSENGDGPRAAIEAARLAAVQAPGAGALSDMRLVLAGLAAEGRFGAGAGRGALMAASADYALALSLDQVSETRAEGRYEDLSLTFEGAALDAGNLAAFLAADGIFDLRMETGAVSGTSRSTGGPSAPPVVYEGTASRSETLVALRGGRAAYSASAEGLTVSYAAEPPAAFPGGGGRAANFEMRLDMPLRRAPEPAPWALDLVLAGLEPDEALWSAVDPAGALGRGPLALEVRLDGAARVTADLGASSLSGPPVAVETLAIRAARLSLPGFAAEAEGALDIVGPASQPEGTVALELRGAYDLLDRAARGGLLAPEAADGYREVLTVYGKPGPEGADHLLADIRLGRGEVTVNGAPLR